MFRASPSSSASTAVVAGPTRNGCVKHNIDRLSSGGSATARRSSAHIADPDVARDRHATSTDGRFYYARVASVTDAGVQPVYSLRVDTDDHAFITNGFVSHNTEARLTPLAMEMLREIDEETVDFIPNYDGRVQEPTVLPSRFPNLLVNGSRRHRGRHGHQHPAAQPARARPRRSSGAWTTTRPTKRPRSTAVMRAGQGPGLPDLRPDRRLAGHPRRLHAPAAARSGCAASSRSRRTPGAAPCWSSPSCPTRSTTTTSSPRSPTRSATASSPASPNIDDQSSDRVGMRIVVELKRDAVAKVVLNNLYKHTQLQTSFGANMLSIVDGVPRTLRLDQMIRLLRRPPARRHRPAHHATGCARPNERAHILRGLVKALDALDEVIALIRRVGDGRRSRAHGLIELLDIDEIQAQAILDMQLRRLAALERQRIIDDLAKIEAEIADLEDILAKPERQRAIVRDELARDRRQVRRRPAHPDHRRRRRRRRRGPDRPRGRRRHDHRDRLRQAHQDRPVPQPEARRQGRAGRRAQAGRHRRALLRLLDARLDPVLHHAGPGVPGQGLRPARGHRGSRAASTSPTCWPSSPRSASPRSSRSRATRTRRIWCWPPATAWSRRPS